MPLGKAARHFSDDSYALEKLSKLDPDSDVDPSPGRFNVLSSFCSIGSPGFERFDRKQLGEIYAERLGMGDG
ncbi:hypothetical protein GGR46_004005 [Sphingomonas kyeonggiensis]|uniref:Uncharacterized protein n=1 Tax=Sphingomonas kyeonggiensis TaxID=1268553 RepID=A0A7W6NYJ9_9SPHN|nr:hypothetical protein [Sphingomonas kyeonggiensis]